LYNGFLIGGQLNLILLQTYANFAQREMSMLLKSNVFMENCLLMGLLSALQNFSLHKNQFIIQCMFEAWVQQ
jgi:hypothetical protein